MPVLQAIYWVHYCNSNLLQVSSTAKLGSQCLPHVVVVRATCVNIRKAGFLACSRCSAAQEMAGLGFLMNLFLSPALRRGPYIQYVPGTWHFPRGARQPFPCLLPSTKPVWEFSYLHHDKTQSWKFGDHQSLQTQQASQQCTFRLAGRCQSPRQALLCPLDSEEEVRSRAPDRWELTVLWTQHKTCETTTNPPHILQHFL